MSNQPDVKVEIAFNAGYSTPPASRTWTDVSSYVEADQKITIGHGRSDEFTVADANYLTLTLDNKDGRFTAQRPASPYYPNVKLGRPIRVTSTPPGGAASTRFVGYVDEWPVEWNGTDAYAKAAIMAHSRIARLGFDAILDSTIAEEYLADDPLVYYSLGEPSEAVAASDSSGNNGPQLTQVGGGADVVFGAATGPGAGSFTAAQFTTAGKTLQCTLDAPPSITSVSVEFFTSSSAGTPQVNLGSALLRPSLEIGPSGFVAVTNLGGSDITVPMPTISDGETHHVCVTSETVAGTTTLSVYADGVLAGSDTGSITGGVVVLSGVLSAGGTTGTVSQLAVYDTVLSPTRIAAHAAAGLTGFAAETASDRIIRYASYAGIPSAEVAADAGTNLVDGYDLSGKTAIDAMRAVEESEAGVLFDARDNTLTFKGRAARYNTTSAFTLDAALQQIEDGLIPKLDRSTLINDATITASDGSTARVLDRQSIDDYGYARKPGDVLGSNEVAFQAASWNVNTYAEPQSRIPAFGVNFAGLFASAALQAAIFAAEVGTRFTSASLPSQAQASSIDYFIEGYTETIGRASYDFLFNVSPTAGFDVWTCEDATFGAFDEYPIAY